VTQERHARREASWDVEGELAAGLATLCRAAGLPLAATLDLDEVRDVEAVVGVQLPAAALALLAFAGAVDPRGGIGLARVAEHTATARDATGRGGFTALATEPRARRLLGLVPHGATLRWSLLDLDTRELTPTSLEAWIAGELASRGLQPTPGARLCVALARRRPVATGRRARHARFGEGVVLIDKGTDPLRKVTVDFPGYGLKVLQARFLEFLG
jgi:hypothetical protein